MKTKCHDSRTYDVTITCMILLLLLSTDERKTLVLTAILTCCIESKHAMPMSSSACYVVYMKNEIQNGKKKNTKIVQLSTENKDLFFKDRLQSKVKPSCLHHFLSTRVRK